MNYVRSVFLVLSVLLVTGCAARIKTTSMKEISGKDEDSRKFLMEWADGGNTGDGEMLKSIRQNAEKTCTKAGYSSDVEKIEPISAGVRSGTITTPAQASSYNGNFVYNSGMAIPYSEKRATVIVHCKSN